jgi:hypothetical protein
MLLKCNLCEKYVTDRHVRKTDRLWLRLIRGRTYLVCDEHRGGTREPKTIRDSNGVSDKKRPADK